MPQVAVVTGGSSGIGAAIARSLAGRGWQCVLVARGEERLRPLADDLGADWETCDVGDRAAVERIAATIRKRHPKIGLLVNNAGIPGRGGFLRASDELIEEVTRTNYLGGVWCTRAFLPALEAAAPSDVVNVVSVAGTVSTGAGGPYYGVEARAARVLACDPGRAPAARRSASTPSCPGSSRRLGFPQRKRFSSRLWRSLVIEPEQVAERVVAAVERDRGEVFVPRVYRIAPFAQVLAPGLVARAGKRGVRPAGD